MTSNILNIIFEYSKYRIKSETLKYIEANENTNDNAYIINDHL